MFRKILIVTLLAALLAACGPALTPQIAPTTVSTQPAQIQTEAATSTAETTPLGPPTSGPTSYVDGLSRKITLDHIPQRVVSLTPATTEILFAVGAGGQVVGRDEFSDFP
ncbi:MAG: ABC transporter substrate-binding protein, partial [Anaerolineales bacterium]